MRVMRRWTRLPREAVAASSLTVFKTRLDGVLSNLVLWKVCLPMAGGMEINLYGPFQPKPFYDSMIHWVLSASALGFQLSCQQYM